MILSMIRVYENCTGLGIEIADDDNIAVPFIMRIECPRSFKCVAVSPATYH